MSGHDSPPAASTARAAARGVAWNYGAQLASVVLQFVYAAITSRLLGPVAFGEYGAALTVSGLLTILGLAGLAQSVSRIREVEPPRVSALVVYALAVGVTLTAFLVLTAPVWALVTGLPNTVPILHVLAIGLFFIPLLTLGNGLMYRLGRYRQSALIVFVCNSVGMALGLALIVVVRQPWTLVASTIVGQASAALLCLIVCRRSFVARPRLSSLSEVVSYTSQITGANMVSYLANNIGRVFVGNTFGAASLGLWNRADVLTTVPFFQVQAALGAALAPEFRHDAGRTDRAKRVWADMLALVAWVCVPGAVVLAVVLPAVAPVLFGDRWIDVGIFIPVLAVTAGARIGFTVLSSALEILGRLKWLWAGHLTALAVSLLGGVLSILVGSVQPVLLGIALGLIGMHVIHLVGCRGAGLLDLPLLLGQYLRIGLVSVGLGAVIFLIVVVPLRSGAVPVAVIGGALLLLVGGGLLWVFRKRLPMVRIAHKYGLL